MQNNKATGGKVGSCLIWEEYRMYVCRYRATKAGGEGGSDSCLIWEEYPGRHARKDHDEEGQEFQVAGQHTGALKHIKRSHYIQEINQKYEGVQEIYNNAGQPLLMFQLKRKPLGSTSPFLSVHKRSLRTQEMNCMKL
jgi:hypothetical protein